MTERTPKVGRKPFYTTADIAEETGRTLNMVWKFLRESPEYDRPVKIVSRQRYYDEQGFWTAVDFIKKRTTYDAPDPNRKVWYRKDLREKYNLSRTGLYYHLRSLHIEPDGYAKNSERTGGPEGWYYETTLKPFFDKMKRRRKRSRRYRSRKARSLARP